MRAPRIVLVVVASCLLAAGASVATAGQEVDTPPEGNWLAGDLHVHTTYSGDSWNGPTDDNTGPEEFYTWGWSVGEQGDIARTRGLDFVTITDHNEVRSQSDPAFGSEGLIWVPGYENSLPGHAQMIGATSVLDNGARDLEAVERLKEELHAAGGVFQINHPSDEDWLDNYGHAFVPDTVEVWNIGPWLYQRPFPASNDNEASLSFWDRFLDDGERVAATGGSDNHWRSVTAVAGVGQPTTWVFAAENTVEGILQGLREGRTTISHQPPGYPTSVRALLEADGDGDGIYESLIGDKVPLGSTLRATVDGADGSYIRLVTNDSESLAQIEIDSNDFLYEIDVPEESTWVRAEVFRQEEDVDRTQLSFACEMMDTAGEAPGGVHPELDFYDGPTTVCTNRLLVLALTSPIYFGLEPSPSPSPTSEF